VILAHHMGEEAIPALIATGATAVPLLLVRTRMRLSRLERFLRTRRRH
jgi:hypothetical protein